MSVHVAVAQHPARHHIVSVLKDVCLTLQSLVHTNNTQPFTGWFEVSQKQVKMLLGIT